MRSASLGRIIEWLQPYRGHAVLAVLLFVVGLVGGNVAGALELKYLVDAIDSSQWGLMRLFWALYGVEILVLPVIMAASLYLLGIAVQRTLRDLRGRIFAKSLNLPASDSDKTSGVVSAIINDANLLGETIANNVPTFCSSVVGAIVAVTVVAFWNPILIALIMVSVSGVSIINSLSARAMRSAVAHQQQTLAQVMDAGSSAVSGYLVVKGLGADTQWQSKFAGVASAHLAAVRKRGRVQAAVSATLGSGSVLHRLVEVVAGSFVLKGSLTAGAAPGIAQLASQVVSPVTQLGATWSALQGGVAASDRIQATLEHDSQSLQVRAVRPTTRSERRRIRGASLLVSDLSYAYPGQETLTISCVSFSIPRGQVIALVGPSGCGKSTLMRLLLGLLPGYHGQITYEIDREVVDSELLFFSYCPQDLQLFRLSVQDNLEMVLSAEGDETGPPQDRSGGSWYGQPGSATESVVDAFGLRELAGELKDGWSTSVTELSGGQRQRVAVARAFLSPASVVFLDEPTGHLDAANEGVIYDAIRRLKSDSTIVLATHSVVNLDWVDRILVLDGGKVVEDGTYAELVEQGGVFSMLHAMQSVSERS